MKIVSWNIAGAHIFTGRVEDASSYGKENLDYFAEQLSSLEPDIILLQEAHTPIDQTREPQAQIIARNLGYEFVNHPYFDRSHIKHGQQLSLATISKLPIEKSYFQPLPNPNLKTIRPNGDVWVTFDAGFLVGTVDYRGVKVNVGNGHMIPYHYFNRDFFEFEDIRNSISELLIALSEKPTLVAGDFNYNNLRKLLPRIFENGTYHESFEGIETAPGRGQQDHILFSNQWVLRNYQVRKEISADHYLCVAELELST